MGGGIPLDKVDFGSDLGLTRGLLLAMLGEGGIFGLSRGLVLPLGVRPFLRPSPPLGVLPPLGVAPSLGEMEATLLVEMRCFALSLLLCAAGLSKRMELGLSLALLPGEVPPVFLDTANKAAAAAADAEVATADSLKEKSCSSCC